MSLVIHLLPVMALVFYLWASAAYLKAFFSNANTISRSYHLILTLGFVFHILFKLAESFGLFGITLSSRATAQVTFPETLSFIALVVTGLYLALAFSGKIKLLGVFVAPLATILFILSGVLFHFVPQEMIERTLPISIYIHVINTIIAISCFLLAFGISMAVLVQERSLKSKQFLWLSKKLPPLATLDKLNARCVGWGVLFLVLGILPGVLYAAQIGLNGAINDLRVISSISLLLIYSLLFFFMKSYGLRGRRAALFSVAGFVAVCFALASNFFRAGFHV